VAVQKHVPTILRSQRADLDQLGDAAAPVLVGLQHVLRVDLQEIEKAQRVHSCAPDAIGTRVARLMAA
jgi:hypothetical protein